MTPAGLQQTFNEAMGQLLGPEFPAEIALAVSGGGDSMAMLYLAHNWTHVYGVRLNVVTVDHGLRAESAAEAAMVSEECAALGWPHTTLRWHWDGQGNLMDAARRGRLALIDSWRGPIRDVLMAHTQDDVAETFVMRLARGSGVDGLSAMAAQRDVGDMRVIRPLLAMSRQDLRHHLRTLHGRWAEDPSNQDDRYERARVRKLLAALQGDGIDTAGLAATAGRMARAQTALRARAAQVWNAIGHEGQALGVPTGDIRLDRDGFAAVEAETQLRLLAGALQYVSGAAYRPRVSALEPLLERLLSGGSGTLLGCEALCGPKGIRIQREFNVLADMETRVGGPTLWDGRWQVAHPDLTGLAVRALGDEGWRQVAEKPAGAPPHALARTLPAVWDGAQLVACDALAVGPGQTTRLAPPPPAAGGFGHFLLSH